MLWLRQLRSGPKWDCFIATVLSLSYSLILLLLDGLRGLEKQIVTEGAWFADDIDEKRDRKPLEIPPRKFSFQAL